ncbi:MAG: chromosome partitioning protein ParB [Deltaproteobacteria bacterium]|nr:chromosome partitioning protein ParB [Deltaproteobacteria bacterium]
MAEQIEISSLDLRYEGYRLKSPGAEKTLLASILENGIRDPLLGVDTGGCRILLDGFKRYRCAIKLHISIVPYGSLGDDEAYGLIDELKTVHQMGTAEIAGLLEKSKAWVSVRAGIIKEMSEGVSRQIFRGRFPVYSFIYTLRPFMRINGVKKDDIDEFVRSVAGKNLSTRDIDLLAHGYFKGPEDLREQIRNGHIGWGLERLRKSAQAEGKCTELERETLTVLEITLKYMQKFITRCRVSRFKTGAFYAQANLLSGGIIRQLGPFSKAIREFYDQSRQA